MRTLLTGYLISLFLVTPALAESDLPPKTRKAMEKEARAACLMGDYQKGTELLVKLFVETKASTYIFNQARCFEQNHRWEEAIDRFREYLRTAPNLPKSDRDDVDKHIAECEGHLPPPVPAPVPNDTPDPVDPPPPPPVVETKPEPAPPRVVIVRKTGSGLKAAGIVSAAVGLAAVGAGVYCNIRHEALVRDFNKNAETYTTTQSADKKNTIQSYQTWGWVSFGVGAAALITGTTLYILGVQQSEDAVPESDLALLPVFGTGHSGLVLSGSF